jgi:hypothetical protein
MGHDEISFVIAAWIVVSLSMLAIVSVIMFMVNP